jgi:uncharacterized membrane protein
MWSLPPIHAAIVHLPIGFVVLSVSTDLIGSWTRTASLQAAGFWSLMGAALTAPLAVLAGYFDMNRANLSAETDGLVHLHLITGWLVLGAITALAAWRWWKFRRSNADPQPHGFLYPTAAVLVLALVGFQGWYGGEMVYAHGASVAPTGQGVEPADVAKRRLQTIYEALGAPGGMGHGTKPGRPETPHSGTTKPAEEMPHRH